MHAITLSTDNAARLASRVAAARPQRCPVCGFAELHLDAVELDGESLAARESALDHRGALVLTECPHCEFRWTSGPPTSRSRDPWAVDESHGAVPVRPGEVHSVRLTRSGLESGRSDERVASAA